MSLNFPFRIESLVLHFPQKSKSKGSLYRQKILKESGNKLLEDLAPYEDYLPLNECFITSSHSLTLFKNIIHVNLPKYSSTYENACLTSLHLAVRNVLDLSMQKEIKSLAFGLDLLKPSKLFPLGLASETILRTIRRVLERHSQYFEKIFFFIEDKCDYEIIKEKLKSFFPRNKREEEIYTKSLPEVEESEYGDILRPQRFLEVKYEFTDIKNSNKTSIDNSKRENIKKFETNQLERFHYCEEDDFRNYKM